MPTHRGHKLHWIFVGLLAAVYLINGIIAIPKLSVNSDEADHFNYAVRLAKGQPDKIKPDEDASCLPISTMNVLPRALQQLIQPSLAKTDNGVADITHGRYLTLLAGLLLGFYVYHWSKRWYGDRGSLVSLALFVFCPNLGAYATTIMTDLYAALFTIIPLYHFWKYRASNSLKQFVIFSLTLGLAQLSKQSLTHLYFIFLLLWIFSLFAGGNKLGNWKEVMGKFFILLGIQILVINMGFQFRHFGKSFSAYSFHSETFNSIKKSAGPLAKLPLPLPEPYLTGIDQSMHLVEMGPGVKIAAADNYLFGKKRKSAFPYYYLAILFFKMPIVTMFAILSAIFLMLRRYNSSFWKNEFTLLFPVIYFLAYFSIGVSIQGGIRFILMILPLLYVLCGRLGASEEQVIQSRTFHKFNLRLYAGMTGLAWLLLSFYYYSPNFVPYTNEFISNKKFAYRVMGDSNLDNGQANYFLQKFLSDHSDYKKATLQPQPGKFYIGVNELLDLYDEGNYSWLLGNFSPAAHVAHSFLLFDVSKEQLEAKSGVAN